MIFPEKRVLCEEILCVCVCVCVCSSDDDSASDYDYTQLVPPQTMSTSESSSDHEDIVAHAEVEVFSSRFVWDDIDSFSASREVFCGVCGPQFDTAELDVVSAFESIFDISLVQLIVDETNRYAQQEISKMARPLTFLKFHVYISYN
jgi:hypothetical protein